MDDHVLNAACLMTRALSRNVTHQDLEICKTYLRLPDADKREYAKTMSHAQSQLCLRVLKEYKASLAYLSCHS
jgi:hypothetical protein